MDIVISICIILVTVIFIIVAIEFIDTLKHIKSAATNIEKLAKDMDNRIIDVEPAFKMVNGVSNTIREFISEAINRIAIFFKQL